MKQTCRRITVAYPPSDGANGIGVFLAGSIENGEARNWQEEVETSLVEWMNAQEFLNVVLYNPRRPVWNANAKEVQINEQIEWEHKYLERADLIAMYLEPGTTSSVSLLELGLHARDNKMIVCCPDGFDRKHNVVHTCRTHGIPLVEDMDAFVDAVKKKITALHRNPPQAK